MNKDINEKSLDAISLAINNLLSRQQLHGTILKILTLWCAGLMICSLLRLCGIGG